MQEILLLVVIGAVVVVFWKTLKKTAKLTEKAVDLALDVSKDNIDYTILNNEVKSSKKFDKLGKKIDGLTGISNAKTVKQLLKAKQTALATNTPASA